MQSPPKRKRGSHMRDISEPIMWVPQTECARVRGIERERERERLSETERERERARERK